MSQSRVTKLTPEQEVLLLATLAKWRSVAFSTEPIDRQKAAEAVNAAYLAIGQAEPELFFSLSPYELINFALNESGNELGNALESQIRRRLEWQLSQQLELDVRSELDRQLRRELHEQLGRRLWSPVRRQLRDQIWSPLNNCIEPELWVSYAGWMDFCISVLQCDYAPSEWQLYQSIVKDCGFIVPYQKVCIICDRPVKLSFDRELRLHAEGEPAIQFADGYSLYSYHGVTIPEKYGKLSPNQWQSQWLLDEWNTERRRVLMQGIGYTKICQELQATELDSWENYSLLKIRQRIDVEPIHLLKMTCPSTGFIHACRVPPDIHSAREAIRWVNWGIDPEEFSVQS
jgi:hypothetical protein